MTPAKKAVGSLHPLTHFIGGLCIFFKVWLDLSLAHWCTNSGKLYVPWWGLMNDSWSWSSLWSYNTMHVSLKGHSHYYQYCVDAFLVRLVKSYTNSVLFSYTATTEESRSLNTVGILKINECTETVCLRAFICTWKQSAFRAKHDVKFLCHFCKDPC